MKFRWKQPLPVNRDDLLKWRIYFPQISRVTFQLLYNRGFKTPEDAQKYLKNFNFFSPEDFSDPRKLPDFFKGATRVFEAIKNKEKILIFGDYDADGITSIAILILFFRQYCPSLEVLYYQPSRFDEGYGFNEEGITFALENKISLIITVDCGITSFKAAELAKRKGIDLIILDHHESGDTLPEAVAVIDPKRKDSELSFRDWAAAGVTFSFICGMVSIKPEFFPNFKMAPFLELAAIGTVVDIAPLTGDNRLIVKAGFIILETLIKNKKGCNKGLRHLRRLAGLMDRPLSIKDLHFIIGPRLNAASRMEEAKCATELLITEDDTKAEELAKKLEEQNEKRKNLQRDIYEKVFKSIIENKSHIHRLIIYADEYIDEGIRGIIATKIAQRFNRPAILFTIDKKRNVAAGSGRSFADFNLYKFMSNFQEFKENGGGHRAAIGIKLPLEKFYNFCEKLLKEADRTIKTEDITPSLNIDAEIMPEEITEDLINFISLMEPFGEGNPSPIFLLSKVHIVDIQIIENNEYTPLLKFTILSSDEAFNYNLTLWDPVTFFELKDLYEFNPKHFINRQADFILQILKNEKNGKTFINLNIIDFILL